MGEWAILWQENLQGEGALNLPWCWELLWGTGIYPKATRWSWSIPPRIPGDAESSLSLPQIIPGAPWRAEGTWPRVLGLCATPGWSDPPGSASLVALGDLKHSRPHPIYSSLAHPRLLPTGSSSPFPGSEARNTSRATTGCSRGSAPGPGHPKMGVPHCWDPPLIQAATNLGQRRGTPGSIHPFLTMEGQPQRSGYGSGYPSGHPARPQSSPFPPDWSQRTQA